MSEGRQTSGGEVKRVLGDLDLRRGGRGFYGTPPGEGHRHETRVGRNRSWIPSQTVRTRGWGKGHGRGTGGTA